MNSSDISTDQLRSALQIREQIESLEQQLTSLLAGGPSTRNPNLNRNHNLTGIRGRRRTMSASARARIAAAQRARWAKVKRTSSSNTSAPRKRRKMSAAGRARIIAATKARWARFHAARK